jgi:GDPmannose 4,6-dehydratase
MKNKIALIVGVTGQDGSYLSQFLLNKEYTVVGSTRDLNNFKAFNLNYLNTLNKIQLVSINISDYYDVLKSLSTYRPDEIYVLGAQSSVGLSFKQPHITIESISLGILNILESVRFLNLSTKIYHASSSEVFGNTIQNIDENTPINPVSPYGVAKATASHIVRMYRESYNLFATNGFMFNHESPLRGEGFVTKKIISAAYDISIGVSDKLELGNIDVHRDWGWAPEYIEAMWLILQESIPRDFIIGSGVTKSLRDFVMLTFQFFGLDYKNFIIYDESSIRPNELSYNSCNPILAKEILGWEAKIKMPDLVNHLCNEFVKLKTKI